MFKIVSRSQKETEFIGNSIAHNLQGNEVIAFFGDLGVGKTTFIKGLCKALGINDNVCSPTYSIVNEYIGKFKVYHFDMYRIETLEDLYSTGYFDYLDAGILLIEWSENIESFLPEKIIKLTMTYGSLENERILTFEGIVEGI